MQAVHVMCKAMCMHTRRSISLFSLLSAATAAAQVPSLHVQLAPVRLLVRDACDGGARSLCVLAALGGDSGGPGAVAALPACACEAAGS